MEYFILLVVIVANLVVWRFLFTKTSQKIINTKKIYSYPLIFVVSIFIPYAITLIISTLILNESNLFNKDIVILYILKLLSFWLYTKQFKLIKNK